MVNVGPLAAEILSLVWGTPGNFNGFGVLAALLHGTLVVGVSQTAALNRGRHLYSAGRPSRWAFAHISSSFSATREVDWLKSDNEVGKKSYSAVRENAGGNDIVLISMRGGMARIPTLPSAVLYTMCL